MGGIVATQLYVYYEYKNMSIVTATDDSSTHEEANAAESELELNYRQGHYTDDNCNRSETSVDPWRFWIMNECRGYDII